MVNKTGFKLMTNCEKCACLNREYDDSSCNLGYHTDLFWTKKNEVIYCSNNCKLKSIRYARSEFKPSKIMVCEQSPFKPTGKEKILIPSPEEIALHEKQLAALNDLRSSIELTPAAPPKRGKPFKEGSK